MVGPDLSVEQINYAGLDAVVPWHLANLVLDELGDAERAYEIAMAATMPAIRMMLRGVLPDMVAHATLSDSLRQALPVAERAYLDACEARGRSELRAKGSPTRPQRQRRCSTTSSTTSTTRSGNEPRPAS